MEALKNEFCMKQMASRTKVDFFFFTLAIKFQNDVCGVNQTQYDDPAMTMNPGF